MNIRRENWDYARNGTFDVAVIGGGINGSCLYHHLCKRGYKVILVDKGDFGCGTSQASGMMVWGGLLYLRKLDFLYVHQLCKAREFMLREMDDQISSCSFRYIPGADGSINRHIIYFSLYLYWLLGMCKRGFPLSETHFEEATLLKNNNGQRSFLIEEAMLNVSDCRFILHWIVPHQSFSKIALNYCSLEGGTYQPADKLWYLDLNDTLGINQVTVRAKCVVNCAGVWTDEINRQFQIETPCKHILSKGVYVGFRRPAAHRGPLIFEAGNDGDVITLVPWGPISLLGPTENVTHSTLEGYSPEARDVQYLLEKADNNLNINLNKSQIVSLRCGIRPLVVEKSFAKDCHTLNITRKHKIVIDNNLPWISVFGGKITGCVDLAKEICKQVSKTISAPEVSKELDMVFPEKMESTTFPGLKEKIPTPEWCLRNEFCCTLEDYLRRRTNVSQWVPREGLGYNNENLPYLKKLAFRLSGNNARKAESTLERYTKRVQTCFDRVVEKV